MLHDAEEHGRVVAAQQKKMRTFEESLKSKKTVASMIIDNKKDAKPAVKAKEAAKKKPEGTGVLSPAVFVQLNMFVPCSKHDFFFF